MSPMTLTRAGVAAATVPPTDQVFDEYMSNIVAQMPTHSGLAVLQGVANSQVSFAFKSSATDEVNNNFYNNLLAPRYEGQPQLYGVGQVKQSSSTFINAYQQLYASLTYQLSQADQAHYNSAMAAVNNKMRTLVPLFNKWVQAVGASMTPPVKELNGQDMEAALMQLTAVMNGPWLGDGYAAKLKADPNYPYQHMTDFNQIYGNIPLSVPTTVTDAISSVWTDQGIVGGLVAKKALAVQTIASINNNLAHASADNGGMQLATSHDFVPGWTFQPSDPTPITTLLGSNPPQGSLTYKTQVTRSASNSLSVHSSTGGGISIPFLDFFSFGVSGGASASIFDQSYAGSSFEVEVVVNNPTVNPMLTMKPLLYDSSTQSGWLDVDPINEARKNGSNTDVTGYVFTGGVPSFDFDEGGDLGFISAAVLSQFLEINITFSNCDSQSVQKFFEAHISSSVSFLGIPLGGASASSSYSSSYSNQSKDAVTVTLRPNPPGYTPGTSSIDDSLCALVAVGVTYPFA